MKLLDIIFETVVEGKQLYTDDDIEKEAKRKDKEGNYIYKTRDEFKNKASWAYDAARKRPALGLDKVCSHMAVPIKGTNFEKTDDEVRNEIKKKDKYGNYVYKTTNQLKSECPWAYNAAKNRKRLGGLNKVCDHMPMSKNGIRKNDPNYHEKISNYNQRSDDLLIPKGTDDELLKRGEEAAKIYDNPRKFQDSEVIQDRTLYKDLSKRKLLPKIEHLYKNHLVRDKYTYEDLKNIILKKDENNEYVYKTKRDLEQGNPRAYHTACASPYWEELTDHMIPLGNATKRMIYVYKFPELKTVYVGLTGDEETRKKQHKTDPGSALYRFMEKNPELTPIYNRETLGYIDAQEASKKETEVENQYKDSGWTLLNVIKTGGLGKTLIYTDELVRTLAKNYTALSDFWREHRKMVNTVYVNRKELYREVTKDMKKYVQPITWTEEKIRKEALKYETLSIFNKKSRGASEAARRMGIYDDISKNMKRRADYHNKNFDLFLNNDETDISQLNLINTDGFNTRITPENRDKFLIKIKSIIDKYGLKLSERNNPNTISATNKLLYNGILKHDKMFPNDKFIPYLFPNHVMRGSVKESILSFENILFDIKSLKKINIS